MFLTHRSQSDELVTRLDPAYWHPAYGEVLGRCVLPLVPMGRFIEHITYGAIVTGRRPQHVLGGIPLLGQGTLRHGGVDFEGVTRVAPGSPWDIERARVLSGDLLIARSGAGSLEKNRLVVYHSSQTALVDCFVDLVRLTGIEPDFVAAFLRTRFGWAQIHRLINGVGPANLSFNEIRSLRVPDAPEDLQREIARRHADEILPLHRRREFGPAADGVRRLVADLERRLGGE